MNDKTLVLTDAEFRAISNAVSSTMKWGPLRESITEKLHAAIDAADLVDIQTPSDLIGHRVCEVGDRGRSGTVTRVIPSNSARVEVDCGDGRGFDAHWLMLRAEAL